MKKTTYLLITGFLFTFALPANANPIENSALFKSLVGKWKGKGELVDQEGNKTKVTEEWEGKFTDSGNFIMSGTRKFDMSEHEFAWEFFANGDLIEGQMKMSDPEIDQRFEIVLDDTNRKITINIPFESSGTSMTIENTVSEDGKKISGHVKIEDESGQTTTTGTVEHQPADS